MYNPILRYVIWIRDRLDVGKLNRMGIGLAVFTHGGRGGYAARFVIDRKRSCREWRLESVCGKQPLWRSGYDIEVLKLDGLPADKDLFFGRVPCV